MMANRCLFTVAMLAAWGSAVRADLRVTADFEGGSAVVDAVDSAQRVVEIRPAGDPGRGWPCWWYLRIDGLAVGEHARLVVRGSQRPVRNDGADTGEPLDPNWSLPTRAAVSIDGVTWRQTEPGDRAADQMSYRLTGTGGSLWVAWGPPFTSRECDELLRRAVAAAPRHANSFELARSREHRPVRGLRITADRQARLPAVWIQARQHAWESGSSWVARGFVEWLLGDEPEAGWLREHADVVVIPVLDVDRVATGDGGKESSPRDHNRDWTATPHYPEIAATQQRLKRLAEEERLALFLDLHNPSPAEERPFFFLPPADILADSGRANRDRFLMFAARRLDAPLPLAAAPRVTGSTYHPLWRQISGVWVSEHANPDTVAACLETPWNTPHSTTDGYLDIGAKLGRTVADFLRFHASRTDAVPGRP